MLPRIRADLNKYRGWLLNRVLRHIASEENLYHEDGIYILPEDLPKVVDDLYTFHCHISKNAANISQYKSLNELFEVVRPYRAAYPFLPEERAIAHATQLQTDTPEALEQFLPAGWRATGDKVFDAHGLEFERENGAKLIARLDDGIEIIHIQSENASRAYGSPRWCTAYRRESTAFESYEDGLIVVVHPEGERWQLHFRTGQFMNTVDEAIYLDDLEKRFPDLRAAIKGYAYRQIEVSVELGVSKINSGLLFCAKNYEEMRKEIDNEKLWQVFRNTDFRKYNMDEDGYGDGPLIELIKLYRPSINDNELYLLTDCCVQYGAVFQSGYAGVLEYVADRLWMKGAPHSNEASHIDILFSGTELRRLCRSGSFAEPSSMCKMVLSALGKEGEIQNFVNIVLPSPNILEERLFNRICEQIMGNPVKPEEYFTDKQIVDLLGADDLRDRENLVENLKILPECTNFIVHLSKFGVGRRRRGSDHDAIKVFSAADTLSKWMGGRINALSEYEALYSIQAAANNDFLQGYVTPYLVPVAERLLSSDEFAGDVMRVLLGTHAWSSLVKLNAPNFLRAAINQDGRTLEPYLVQKLEAMAEQAAVHEHPEMVLGGKYANIRKYPDASEPLQAEARNLANDLLSRAEGMVSSEILESTRAAIQRTFAGLSQPSPQTTEWLAGLDRPSMNLSGNSLAIHTP
jgi:hypothetical protein